MNLLRSAVIRLTVWYLLIIMVMSALFSVVLYRGLSTELDAGYRRQTEILQQPAAPAPSSGDRERFESLRYEQLEQTKHHLLRNLLLINLAIFLVGAGASYLLARRTLRPIQESLEAQRRFTADASHELRTPLAAMRAEIEVALRGKPLSGPAVRKLLASTLEEIGRLEALSAALLELAAYEHGLPEPVRSAVSVREVISQAGERVAGLAKRRRIKITAPTGRQRVLGDRASLTELFVILLDNAIKYSPSGTTVAVAAKRDGGQVEITVTDRGIGIKASELPHLFERFYRADASRSGRIVPGYGLGLSLAQQIVSVHGGRIAVASTPGQGTTVTVGLPVAGPKT